MNLFNANIAPGRTYKCVNPWVNEMGYIWKAGEAVVVVELLEYSVVVRSVKEHQHFEILLTMFNENFQ